MRVPTPTPGAGPIATPLASRTPETTPDGTPVSSSATNPLVPPVAGDWPEDTSSIPAASHEPGSSTIKAPAESSGAPDNRGVQPATVDNGPSDRTSEGDPPPLFQEPDLAPVSFTTAGLGLGIEWVVPTFLITVPGFLVIGIGLAQVFGGFAWLPLVRRLLRGDGRRATKSGSDRDRTGLPLGGRR
jgi:hypothetical protein